MFRKIFINVLFENKKILIAFSSILVILFVYIGVQVMFATSQLTQLAMPDIEITGKLDSDGLLRYKLYNDQSGLSSKLKELYNKDYNIYPVVSRNILSNQSTTMSFKVNYWIYGVENNFFDDQLKGYIKDGRMPKPGEKETLIGNYAAHYYKVKVGDKIKIPVTLKKDYEKSDISTYTVSGILDDNIDYFKGAIFISRDTYESINSNKTVENLVLIYSKKSIDSKEYEKIYNSFIGLKADYNIGQINANFYQKDTSKRNVIINIIFVLFMSVIIVFLLLSYLMKGITKKIGLLKALGISDSYIIKTFLGGLSVTVVFATLLSIISGYIVKTYINKKISEFLEFSVSYYSINKYVILFTLAMSLLMFIVIFVIIKLKSSRISPRDAMLKS
ncbi:MAG TPA: FtsX-like permease family protein [Pseudobacteroides sp.]|uniref:ABC transporter permease n=1 Tax=Pseudobacteroides sp. TaxID=1968840 RepID=UPI002F940FD6